MLITVWSNTQTERSTDNREASIFNIYSMALGVRSRGYWNLTNLKYLDTYTRLGYLYWTDTTVILVLDAALILLGCKWFVSYFRSPLFHIFPLAFILFNIKNVANETMIFWLLIQKCCKEKKVSLSCVHVLNFKPRSCIFDPRICVHIHICIWAS